jgi:hypothetical protein
MVDPNCLLPQPSLATGSSAKTIQSPQPIHSKEQPMLTQTTRPNTNGNFQRKTLAHQLDRLDSILDGLDNALQGAITDAVKTAVSTAVGETVRATLLEIATNPDILALLRSGIMPAVVPPAAPTAPATGTEQPGPIRRAGRALASAWAWGLKRMADAGRAIAAPVRNAYTGAITTYRQINAIWQLRRPIIVSLAVGVTVGIVVGYVAAPWLSGVISGIGAMSATLSAQLAIWTRRLFGGLSMT